MDLPLIISLSLNSFFILIIVAFLYNKLKIPGIIFKFNWFKKLSPFASNIPAQFPFFVQRDSLFEVLPKTNDEIIFIGDSLTNGCEWSELFQNAKIKNRGIVSDNSAGVLNRIDKTLESKPTKIFLMIGVNDLSSDIPLNSIIRNYIGIIKKIKSISVSTEIFIQSILPTNNNLYKGKATNDKIKTLNEKLINIADEYNLIYMDIFSHLINADGQLDEKYSNDGVHLLGLGYLVWKQTIEKNIT